jgi:hypothetical protein
MSTEDKANEVSVEVQDQHPATPPTDAEAPGKDDGAGGTITLFFIVGLVASLVLGWVIFPQLLYSKKKQPIDFNHALHNELVDESCESCHFFREDGTYSGVPKFSHIAHVKMGQMDCVTCHGHIGESESLKIYEANRITGYSRDIWGKNIAGIKWNSWDRMKMDDCSECHQRENVNQGSVQTAKGGCFVCHK